MKNKTVLIVVGVLVVCLCVCVAAGVGLAVTGALAMAPHTFTNEQMTADYLADKKELAGYKQVDFSGLGGDIFGGNIAYYTKDGQLTADTTGTAGDVILVYVGDDSKEFSDNIEESKNEIEVDENEKKDCDPYKFKSGSFGDTEYYEITCDDDAVYGYSNGDRYIMFTTTNGADLLNDAIEDYKN